MNPEDKEPGGLCIIRLLTVLGSQCDNALILKRFIQTGSCSDISGFMVFLPEA
jgi:hypothetical protein